MLLSLHEAHELQKLETLKIRLNNAKSVQRLNEGLKTVYKVGKGKKRLSESHVSRVLLETIDVNDVAAIEKVMGELDQITDKLPTLNTIVKNIKDDVSTTMNQGWLKKKWNSIKSKFLKDFEPVPKALAFIASIKQGFSQLATILKVSNFDLKKLPQDKPIVDVNTSANIDKRTQNAKKLFLKAIQPNAFWGKTFKSLPYVSNEQASQLANEVFQLNPGQVFELINNITRINVALPAQDVQTIANSNQQNQQDSSKNEQTPETKTRFPSQYAKFEKLISQIGDEEKATPEMFFDAVIKAFQSKT